MLSCKSVSVSERALVRPVFSNWTSPSRGSSIKALLKGERLTPNCLAGSGWNRRAGGGHGPTLQVLPVLAVEAGRVLFTSARGQRGPDQRRVWQR